MKASMIALTLTLTLAAALPAALPARSSVPTYSVQAGDASSPATRLFGELMRRLRHLVGITDNQPGVPNPAPIVPVV